MWFSQSHSARSFETQINYCFPLSYSPCENTLQYIQRTLKKYVRTVHIYDWSIASTVPYFFFIRYGCWIICICEYICHRYTRKSEVPSYSSAANSLIVLWPRTQARSLKWPRTHTEWEWENENAGHRTHKRCLECWNPGLHVADLANAQSDNMWVNDVRVYGVHWERVCPSKRKTTTVVSLPDSGNGAQWRQWLAPQPVL